MRLERKLGKETPEHLAQVINGLNESVSNQ